MRELKETVALMLSKDEPDRLLAEYYQLERRMDDLVKIGFDGTGEKMSNDDEHLIATQYYIMNQYKNVLELRMKIKGIEVK